MIPSIAGIHWGWNRLQDVPALVKPEEKKEPPYNIVSISSLNKLKKFLFPSNR